jgi:hypothetical protein
MCTMSWCRGADGLEVFFTRDERRTRLPADPPSVETRNGVRYIAPTDRDAGGTWLTVNERGFVWGVANFYAFPMDVRPPGARSRGRLVRDLADVVDLSSAAARLAAAGLDDCNPFVLVGLMPEGQAVRWIWDGAGLRSDSVHQDDLPITTNPFDPREAELRRGNRLRAWIESAGGMCPAALNGFHRDRRGPDAALDVCMSTPVARSVSLSHITVEDDRVGFSYHPVDDDRNVAEPGVRQSLPRSP